MTDWVFQLGVLTPPPLGRARSMMMLPGRPVLWAIDSATDMGDGLLVDEHDDAARLYRACGDWPSGDAGGLPADMEEIVRSRQFAGQRRRNDAAYFDLQGMAGA